MNRLGLSGLFIVLAVGLTGAQSPARLVEIQVTLPGGGHPVLKVHEGETASVTMPEMGRSASSRPSRPATARPWWWTSWI